jgi:hypothetical protein
MSGWPDPDKPGMPLNPERDGTHWFKVNINGEDIVFVAEWDAHEKFYTWSCGEAGPVRCAAAGWTYAGPVLTPDEAGTLRAENARLRSLADRWETLVGAIASHEVAAAIRATLAGEVKP